MDIKPTGYFTQVPEVGGGTGDFSYLLDPTQTAGAYEALLRGNLLPVDVNNYDAITSTSPLSSGGPFNLLPTPEGAVTLGVGAINPLLGLFTRGAITNRNVKALETLANEGILTRTKDPTQSGQVANFLGRPFKAGSGEYRLSDAIHQEIVKSDMSADEFFQKQFDNDYKDASELAQYLDQVAYTTQGQFFQKDLFGNDTPYSKYVDRQGNIKPDALDQWKQFGQQDKRGVLRMLDKQEEDQGTQQDSGGFDASQRGSGINSLQTSEPRGQTPDFLQRPTSRVDAKGRKLAGGTSNLLLG